MTLIEFIGFIITMAAFFFLMVKQSYEARHRKAEPEEDEEAAYENAPPEMKEILEAIGAAPKMKIRTPPAPKPVLMESVLLESPSVQKEAGPKTPAAVVLHEAYAQPPQESNPHTKASELLGSPQAMRQAILLREIIGPPKGLSHDPW